MLSFSDLIAPITTQQFRDEYLGRRPLHVPADSSHPRSGLLDWKALNRLLDQSAIWTAHTLRLVHNRVAVPPGEYCQIQKTPTGDVYRPSAQKIQIYLAGGASLVANEVQTLDPNIARLTGELSRAMAAQVGANVYCSFSDIQAFGSHYDVHDVFAVQTEGEKIWRIYDQQVELPIELPPDSPETRAWLERARGQVATEVRMRPGDVLYLPRGRFHDAIAVDGPSLHVTFSVTPLYGRILFSLLDNAAMQLPAFRASFAPFDVDEGRSLSGQLARLGEILNQLVISPAFLQEVRMAQERLVPRPSTSQLPLQKVLTYYRPTGLEFPRGDVGIQIAYSWCHGRERFCLEDLISEMDFIDPDRLRTAIARAEAAGALSSEPS